MARGRRRKCKCCRRLFRPDPALHKMTFNSPTFCAERISAQKLSLPPDLETWCPIELQTAHAFHQRISCEARRRRGLHAGSCYIAKAWSERVVFGVMSVELNNVQS
jgi:hypothetical protein